MWRRRDGRREERVCDGVGGVGVEDTAEGEREEVAAEDWEERDESPVLREVGW